MKKISTAELKKAILAGEAERLKHPAPFRPDRAQRAAMQKSRRASEKMIADFLKKAGLDIKKLQAMQERRSVELERMVAKHKTEALRRASRHKDALHSSIAQQSEAFRDLASKRDFFPHPTFTLDTPFLIWSIPLADISDSAAVPFGSFAKFKFSTSRYQGTQKVGFYFYWVNDFSDFAVINATTFLSATGHLKSHAPWGIGVNTSQVGATALLNLWFGWPTDVTSTASAAEFLGSMGSYGDWLGGDTNGVSISSGVQLSETMFAVPPNNVVVFEVAVAIDYENDDGDIEADFESGDFKIACPLVVFSLLNSPPSVIG